jgi:hypothetical protein
MQSTRSASHGFPDSPSPDWLRHTLPPGCRQARGGQVVDEVLHPGEVGVPRWGRPELPAHILPEPLAAPVAHVEGGLAMR